MNDQTPPDFAQDGIEQGKSLIRLSDDKGLSLTQRLANNFYRLTWSTPLHAMRLKGKYPLKLLAVPDDPIPGDARAGKALQAGYFLFRGLKQPLESLDFANLAVTPAFADYIHSFRWLRDLATVAKREQAAPIAEAIMRKYSGRPMPRSSCRAPILSTVRWCSIASRAQPGIWTAAPIRRRRACRASSHGAVS